MDGLYDVWGQFPEIVEISPESGVTKLFPSLEELRKIPFTPGDSREVHLETLHGFSIHSFAQLPCFTGQRACCVALLQTIELRVYIHVPFHAVASVKRSNVIFQ